MLGKIWDHKFHFPLLGAAIATAPCGVIRHIIARLQDKYMYVHFIFKIYLQYVLTNITQTHLEYGKYEKYEKNDKYEKYQKCY